MLKKNKMYAYSAVFLLLLSFVYVRSVVLAEDLHLVPDEGKADGSYTLNDLIGVGLTVVKFILYLSGSVALLAFVYGGFLMLVSAGNKNRIEEGKNAIIAAVMGLAIVFLAFTAVDFFLKKIKYTGSSDWNTIKDIKD